MTFKIMTIFKIKKYAQKKVMMMIYKCYLMLVIRIKKRLKNRFFDCMNKFFMIIIKIYFL